MRKVFHTSTMQQSRISDDGVANPTSVSQIATKCVRQFDAQRLAGDLGISARTVQRWKSGQEAIPLGRHIQIVTTSKKYFLTDLHELEDAIDRALMAQFGAADKGRF